MRILLAILIWAVFIGGTALYLSRRESAVKTPKQFVREKASGIYAVEITATFAAEPDAFSIHKFSVLLKLDGKPLLENKEKIEAGKSMRVEPVPGIVVGENEFYFEANPLDEELNQAHAVRVRIFRGGETIAEHSLWSDPGTKLATTFRLKVAPKPNEHEGHSHAH